MRSSSRFLLLGAAALVVAARAGAQTALSDLQAFQTDTDGYNVIGFSQVTLGQEVIGTVAAGNLTATTSNVQIGASSASGSNPSLFVNGALTVTGSNQIKVQTGQAYTPSATGWSWNNGQKYLKNGSGAEVLMNGSGTINDPLTTGSKPTGWSTMQTNLETVSTNLAALTPTYSATVSNNTLIFDDTSSDEAGSTVVFSLNVSNIGSYNQIQFDFATGVNYVINVTGFSGASESILSGNFLGNGNSNGPGLGAEGAQTIWNFEDSGSTALTIGNGSAFYGSVLAPEASIAENGEINGQVAASSFSDFSGGGSSGNASEVEFDTFSVNLPESGAIAGWAAALCAGALLWRLSRRHRACPA